MNKFADWTNEEYNGMLGFRPILEDKNLTDVNESSANLEDLPASINWVEQGVVSPIKDQGKCGSCWSFSATGAIESAYQIKNGEPILMSEQ